LQTNTLLESISDQKTTALGQGYFVTWVTTYTDEHGEVVGRQLFRVLKFKPATAEPNSLPNSSPNNGQEAGEKA
jgi:hypothetical protein